MTTMKENTLQKIYQHPDRDEVISKLTLGFSPQEIHAWLNEKYIEIGDRQLIITVKTLKTFKDEYLNVVKQIQQDCVEQQQKESAIIADMQNVVQNNSAYRAKLNDYLDREINIKSMLKNMILAVEHRAMQVFDNLQETNKFGRSDYAAIQWFNMLLIAIEKYEPIINGSSDKIIQQNHINIQILDQHIGVFHKVIREVISRLDYDTSLLFVDILNEELKKLKASPIETMSVDVRLSEAKKLEDHLVKLDVPTA